MVVHGETCCQFIMRVLCTAHPYPCSLHTPHHMCLHAFTFTHTPACTFTHIHMHNPPPPPPPPPYIQAMCLAAGKKILFSAGTDHTLRSWDLSTLEEVAVAEVRLGDEGGGGGGVGRGEGNEGRVHTVCVKHPPPVNPLYFLYL